MSERRNTWEADLSAMATDPEMQRELNRINGEFTEKGSEALREDVKTKANPR